MFTKETVNKIHDIAERLGWTFTIKKNDNEYQDYCYQFENYSPAGENLVVYGDAVGLDELAEYVRDTYRYFDPEEHAVMWYGADRGEPRSLRVLLDDAEAIEGMYEELAIAITQAANCGPTHEDDDTMDEKLLFLQSEIEDRPMTPMEIYDLLGMDINHAMSLISRLEITGVIERRPDGRYHAAGR